MFSGGSKSAGCRPGREIEADCHGTITNFEPSSYGCFEYSGRRGNETEEAGEHEEAFGISEDTSRYQ
tara:strand:- start:782 stop:982 length:201 start_codon:yes stop_codon:yes gene_type:complete